MTTQYQKGVRAEYQLRHELEERGWTVIRSAGSHGPADLVAWSDYAIEFMQVKRCRSVSQVKAAVREAIDKFEAGGICRMAYVVFSIWIRYRGMWVRVWRSSDRWVTGRGHQLLLGQTEWPITEQEV